MNSLNEEIANLIEAYKNSTPDLSKYSKVVLTKPD